MKKWFFLFLVLFLGNGPLLHAQGSQPCLVALSISSLREISHEEVKSRLNGRHVTELLGMSRDEKGQLLPIFDETLGQAKVLGIRPEFSSEREVRSEGSAFGGGWNSRRAPRIIELEWNSYSDHSFVESTETSILPEALQKNLREGRIPVTSSHHTSRAEWHVLMIVAPPSKTLNPPPEGGRTGILLHNGVPIILRDDKTGKEFLVELKGVGSSSGGYEKSKDWGFRGGALPQDTVREHENMVMTRNEPESLNGDAIISGGYSLFKTSLGEQGLGIRLTVGTIRSTFSGNGAFVRTSESVLRTAEGMGKNWGRYLHRGMIPTSHAENLVVDAKFENFFMTDFADIMHVERLSEDNDYIGILPYKILTRSLTSFLEIPTLEPKSGLKAFIKGLVPQLRNNPKFTKDYEQRLLQSATPKEMIDIIWSSLMVPAIVETRLRIGSVPEDLRHRDMDKLTEKTEFKKNLKSYIEIKLARMKSELRQMGHAVEDGLRRGEIPDSSDRFFSQQYRAVATAKVLIPLFEQFLENKRDYTQIYLAAKELAQKDPIFGNHALWTVETCAADAYALKEGIVSSLKNDLSLLRSVSSPSNLITDSIRIAEERIALIQDMSPQDFNKHYYGRSDEVVALYFLPYNSLNLSQNPNLQKLPQFKRHEDAIRRLFFPKPEGG